MRRIFIIAALLLLPVICLVAQQYPVQVTPQLLPPYSLQVSDYTSAVGSPKLNLLLLLRDFNKPSLQVRLRMSITGQSVAITTREDVAFTAIEILSGQPKYIQPADLTEYFNSNNLTFSGITRSQYEQTGKLPEGFYTFCFEVVDIVTGQTVSNKGCTVAWLTLSEPPLLNIPRKSEALIPVIEVPQNVIFQWTPRHTASPTAAYTIEYHFKLVEIPQGTTVSPEAGFSMYPAIYEETTTATTLLYSGIVPQIKLNQGYTYAWQVQAIAKNGTQDVAMFRNNGFSEIFWFVYQNNCPAPTNINATAQGQRVNISWGGDVQHLDYKVEYRKANTAGAEWFELSNTTPNVSITDLEPSIIYEYRIGAACETGKYIFSTIHQFTTNNATATTVPQCGFEPNPAPTTEPLLQEMHVGDIIKAGDFDVVVTQVSGSSSFNGQGYVVVPWLANMKLGVRFENIGVATDLKLKVGEIMTTYDPTEAGIVDVDEVIANIQGLADLLNELITVNITAESSYIKQLTEQVTKIVNEELPANLKNGFVAATKTIDSAKTAYDALKNTYESLPNGPEKDAVKANMEIAKSNFENAQKQLSQLNMKRDKLVTDIVQVIVASVRELEKDYTYTGTTKLKAISDTLRTEIYTEQQLDSIPHTTWEYIQLESYTDDLTSYDEDYAEFNRKAKSYLAEKKALTTKKLFEILFSVFGTNTAVEENVKEDELFNGKLLIRALMEKLDKGEDTASLIKYTKRFLTDAISESAQLLND